MMKLNNGNLIPSIGLGTYNINYNIENLIYQACKIGYKHFDTAVLYDNELEIVNGLKKFINEGNSRSEIFYTTKLWTSQSRSTNINNHYEITRNEIIECLDKAKDLQYIDLLLIHSPLAGKDCRKITWEVMEEFVLSGKIKNIGVSNYGIGHLTELLDYCKIKPVINQIEISPWIMRSEIVEFCNNNDIIVEAYAPLTHGYKLRNPPIELKNLMDKYNKDSAQILIKWSLSKGLLPLPKTKTIERLSTNLNIDDFELSNDDIESLDHPDAYEPTDWDCVDAP